MCVVLNKSLLLALLLFVGVYSAQAQNTKSRLNRANKAYKEMAYQEAIEGYLEILDRFDVAEAKINIADCYRKIGNTSEAEYWYSQAVILPDAPPITKLYCAMALQSNGKCEKAKKYFEEYSRLNPDDLRGILLAKSCETLVVGDLLSRNAEFYEINRLKINSNFKDFAASFFGENELIFSSNRDNKGASIIIDAQTGEAFNDLYVTKIKSNGDVQETSNTSGVEMSKPKKFSKLNKSLHDGGVCLSPDKKTMYITRNSTNGKSDDGVRTLKIYELQSENDSWSRERSLVFNSDEYSCGYPSMSADGTKLYFASDMPGGFGGLDLYVSSLEDGRWSPPVNLGPEINTEGQEFMPFIHPTGDLYFASNGHIGLGGYDNYVANISDAGNGAVVNLGYPINSTADDLGIILSSDKSFGYYTSNREGGAGDDDLYHFKRLAVEVEILVTDKLTGNPLTNATIGTECNTQNYETDATGRVVLDLPLGKSCEFVASQDGYTADSKRITTKGKSSGGKLQLRLELTPETANSVQFTGILKNNTQTIIPNATITLVDERGQNVAETKTDANGKYSFKLPTNGNYTLKAKADNHLVSNKAISTQNYKGGEKVSNELTLTSISNKENKTVALVVNNIYYAYGQADLLPESKPNLDQLAQFMRDNPAVVVEIGSHTDPRGSAKFNMKLSVQRADAVQNYLVGVGIPAARMMTKGYGETQPLNTCVDKNSGCTEEQFQENRRTEFKIIGTTDGKRFDTTKGSIRIDMD